MTRVLLLVLLVACGGDGDGALSSCPSEPIAPGTACEGDLACAYPEVGGRTSFCVCQQGHMWCSDCSDTGYGFGACTAGEGCTYSSWETDCDCSCTANGTWNCTSLDAVSPCPHDP